VARKLTQLWKGNVLNTLTNGHKASRAPRVVIIGAGIVGIIAANELLLRGNKVTVVDNGKPEDRCSYGNAGSLSPGSVAPFGMPGVIKQVPGMLVARTAPLRIKPSYLPTVFPWLAKFVKSSSASRVEEISIALGNLLSGSIERFESLLRQFDVSELLMREGQLQLYRSRRQMGKDASVWALRRRRGVEVVEVDREDIRRLEPNIGPLYTCGVFLPNEGMITDPARLVETLARQFVQRGGEFHIARATGFESDTGLAKAVLTDTGTISADAVVIAAGAWSNELTRQIGDDLPLETQRGYHITLPDCHGVLNRPVVAADRKFFVTPMDVGLRVAGTVEFDSLSAPPNPTRADALASALPQMLPRVPVDNRSTWMGHRPCMPDSLPVLDRSTGLRNVFYAFGNGHLGLTSAPAMAHLVCELVMGRQPNMDIAAFSAGRFQTRSSRDLADVRVAATDLS